MFGWLKSLFGSEPVKEVVIPPLPKVKKVKKAEKTASNPLTKKKESKVKLTKEKAVKAPAKKKEVVSVVEVPPVVEIKVAETTPKKKGGRPKKNDNKVG